MMKRYTIILLLLLTSYINGSCQDNSIKVYTYHQFSEQATLLKKSLINYIKFDKQDSVKMLIDKKFFLIEYGNSSELTWLSNSEMAIIAFYLGKYDKALDDIIQNQHYFNDTYIVASDYFYKLPQFKIELKEFFLVYSSKILDEIASSSINMVEKEILTLYWKNIINNFVGFPKKTYYNQDSLNEISKKLINDEIRNEYKGFIKRYLQYIYQKSDWGIGLDINFIGKSFFMGELSDNFKSGSSVIININVPYKNWLYGFRFSGFDTDIKYDIAYKTTWYASERISTMSGSIDIGYSLVNNKKIRLTPTGGISIGGVNYFENDSLVERTDVFLQPNFAIKMDYNFKIPIKRFIENHRSYYGSDKDMSTWYLRLYGGCYPLGFNNVFNSTGSILYFNLGIGYIYCPPIRKIE